jgi:hypothetical protein
LRHHDEQSIAKIRRPMVGRDNRGSGGGGDHAQPHLEKIPQIDADMTGATTAAEHHDARLCPLDPFGDVREKVGACQKPAGSGRNFRRLARHCACCRWFSGCHV